MTIELIPEEQEEVQRLCENCKEPIDPEFRLCPGCQWVSDWHEWGDRQYEERRIRLYV